MCCVTDSICTLSKEDFDLLLDLYKTAKTTPVIKFSSDPNEKDLATIAWDSVREFQKALGKKYNYDWEKNACNAQGEVIPI